MVLIISLITTMSAGDLAGDYLSWCNEIIPATMLNQAAHAKKPVGRPRNTGCKQGHKGAVCPDCNRIRVQRHRAAARKRQPPPPRPAPSEPSRVANAAAAYVRAALKRQAIAPPDACERCEVTAQPSPSWPVRPLRFFHPDPREARVVAWLCSACYRDVRANREPLTLTWTWPGITAPRSRKLPDLAIHVAAALRALTASGATSMSTTLREAAFVRLLLRTLTPGERERLYAAGVLTGPRWRPTGQAGVDRVLRGWVFEERAERGVTARGAGGITLTPLQPEARRGRRRPVPPEPAAPMPRAPFDRDAAFAKLDRADKQLAAATAEANATMERVSRAVRERLG